MRAKYLNLARVKDGMNSNKRIFIEIRKSGNQETRKLGN